MLSDKKHADLNTEGAIVGYRADVLKTTHYYPFGMEMKQPLATNTIGYRYGFNGKEKDPEWGGGSNVYDYGFRIYNPAIAKFLSVDPLTRDYPWYTPYQFAGNKPIWFIDLDGLEEALPWYLTPNAYGGKPVLTFGIPALPIANRKAYSPETYMVGYNGGVGLYNTLISIYNNNVQAWNEARVGKTGSEMLRESSNGIERLVEHTSAEEYKAMATNPETYENLAGGLLTAYFIKRVLPNKPPTSSSSSQSTSLLIRAPIEVTEASIAAALEGSTMKTLQGKVSLPMVQRYVKMLEDKQVPPPIKVADGVIIEGNHRYIAGRLFGKEPDVTPYTLSPSQASRVVPIQETKVDIVDWEN